MTHTIFMQKIVFFLSVSCIFSPAFYYAADVQQGQELVAHDDPERDLRERDLISTLASYSIEQRRFVWHAENFLQHLPLDRINSPYLKGLKLFYGFGIQQDFEQAKSCFIQFIRENMQTADQQLARRVPMVKEYVTSFLFKGLCESALNQIDTALRTLESAYIKYSSIEILAKLYLVSFQYSRHQRAQAVINNTNYRDVLVHAARLGDRDAGFLIALACLQGNLYTFFNVDKEEVYFFLHGVLLNKTYQPAIGLFLGEYLFETDKAKVKEFNTMMDMIHGKLDDVWHSFQGMRYLLGHDTIKKNTQLAILEFKMAALLGSNYAHSILGIIALDGFDDEGNRADINYQKVVDLFEQDPSRPISQYNLATLYLNGLGVEKDTARGEAFLRKIFDNESLLDPGLVLMKALIYMHGLGSHAQNFELAQECLDKIANEAHKKAFTAELKKIKAEKSAQELIQSELDEALVRSVAAAKKAKKNKKIVTEISAGSSSSQPVHEETAQEEDFAGLALTKALNSAIRYNDKSFIAACDTAKKQFLIKRPGDDMECEIILETMKPVTQYHLKQVGKPLSYASRISDAFTDYDARIKKKQPIDESLARHAFPERIDEIVQLYGQPAYLMGNNNTIIKNYTLSGSIKTAAGKKYEGTFEYGFGSDNILYHRFCHRHSRTTGSYAEAAAV